MKKIVQLAAPKKADAQTTRLGIVPAGHASIVLGEVADLASTIDKLATMQLSADDPGNAAALTVAVRALGGQIGFYADLLGAQARAQPGDAVPWLLPDAVQKELRNNEH